MNAAPVRKLFLASTVLAVLLAGSLANAQTTLTAGVDDMFAAPSDPANPSADLVTVVDNQGFNATESFDVFVNNNNAGHTFLLSLGPDEVVTSAILNGRVRANPGANATATGGDGILLSAIDSTSVTYLEAVLWSRNFGPIADNGAFFPDNDPGLIQSTPWLANDEGEFSLDLSALPNGDGSFTNLLPVVTSRGLLDVVAGDDSAVDFYRLEYTVITVPEPSSAVVAGALAASCFGLRARRR